MSRVLNLRLAAARRQNKRKYTSSERDQWLGYTNTTKYTTAGPSEQTKMLNNLIVWGLVAVGVLALIIAAATVLPVGS